MIILTQIQSKLSRLQARARRWPYAGRITFLLGLILMLLLINQEHHLSNPATITGYNLQNGKLTAEHGGEPPSVVLKYVSIILPYLDTWIIVGGIIMVSIFSRQWGILKKLVLPSWLAGASIGLWACCRDIADQVGSMQMTEMGEPMAFGAYWLKLVLLFGAALCMPALFHYYVNCGSLNRYTMRTFLVPLVFCFFAFTALWVIMDLLDNLKDFQEVEAPLGRVLSFYLGVMPFIFVSVMPASLLLSVLYTLTRMSRANEIVAMLGVGRSVVQILAPLFVVAATVSVISSAANFHWAPRAEGKKEAVIRGLEGKQKDSIMQSSIMYHDVLSLRTWYISSIPFSMKDGRVRGVQVREQDSKGQISRVIHADSATWFPGGLWRFYNGKEVCYEEGRPTAVRCFLGKGHKGSTLDVANFHETPWSMISYDLQPDFMGVPELVSYLKAHPKDGNERLAPFRTHFHQRLALPWQCFALALVSAPLGIAYSRRGAVGGIAGSIFIFFSLLFLNNLCLNLGKGSHLPSWLSPWIPHLLFGILGVTLIYYRSQNKDLPSLSLKWLFGAKSKIIRPRNRQAA